MDAVRKRLPMRRIANIFGAVGYSLLLFTYAVIVGVGLLWLVKTGSLVPIGITPDITQPSPVDPAAVMTEVQAPPLAMQIVQALFLAVMSTIVLFVVVSLPYWLGRCGSHILKRCIRLCQVPVTLMSLLIGKVIACGMATVPVLIVGIYDFRQLPIVIVLLTLVTVAMIIFLLQHYLAQMSEVTEAKDIW